MFALWVCCCFFYFLPDFTSLALFFFDPPSIHPSIHPVSKPPPSFLLTPDVANINFLSCFSSCSLRLSHVAPNICVRPLPFFPPWSVFHFLSVSVSASILWLSDHDKPRGGVRSGGQLSEDQVEGDQSHGERGHGALGVFHRPASEPGGHRHSRQVRLR